MYHFDASSIIHAWDTYPIDSVHFDSFWDSFKKKLNTRIFLVSETAAEEVERKAPDCYNELKTHLSPIPLTAQITDYATYIQHDLLEIEDEAWGRGVGEKDLLIIATAIMDPNSKTLVSEEKQPTLSGEKKNYKIPAVCDLLGSPLDCCNILTLINEDKI